MVNYKPADGAWEILRTAGNKDARDAFSKETFNTSRQALKEVLCAYFSSGNCAATLGSTISPMGATPKGGKILKVRWGLPGCGKSGSLRLAVVVYCSERRVVIADAFVRKDEPSTRAFLDSVAGLD